MQSNIIIVDKNDEVIGSKLRGTLDYQDIYRVSALWLRDATSGDILLAQRKWTKVNDPGKWSAAASGTNDVGETYEQNIVKEVREEIGLHDLELTLGPKQFVDDGEHKYFCQWFLARVDKQNTIIIPQEDEVENTKWISQSELAESVKVNPSDFPPSTKQSLAALGVIG